MCAYVNTISATTRTYRYMSLSVFLVVSNLLMHFGG